MTFDRSRAEAVWWTAVFLMVALVAITTAAALADPRPPGAATWAKPLKFEAAVAVHLATLALVASRLGEAWRRSRTLEAVAWVSAACAVLEVAYIGIQAARLQPSHFNTSTPLHAALYTAMAVGAVTITATAGLVGAIALLDPGARLGPATRWGVGLGLLGGTVLTFVAAFALGGASGHHVGVEAPGAPRVPLAGWSLTVGDRRIAHFFATHMMQVVPLAGLLLDRKLPPVPALVALCAVVLAWTALTLFLFFRADAGLPPVRWET